MSWVVGCLVGWDIGWDWFDGDYVSFLIKVCKVWLWCEMVFFFVVVSLVVVLFREGSRK